ncbi:ABC transporter ATP-binding protein [Candidatus Aerophobetes bacterium]|uniref:ABC transporter ATP-binding protein n=1 Tax=Aerophobetes bacterium TaxID=2030807 RepID=A0A662DGD7_UNCAE|nr:MAG: ABC transporter ATP-binding protein [Candidatus Aerophobetes bacterium]
MTTTSRLLKYFRPYLGYFVLGIVCTIIGTLITLVVPWVIGKNLIDSVILEGKNLSLLNLVAIGLLVLFIIKGGLSYGQTYLMSRVSFGVVTDLRNQAYEHLQRLSLSFYKKRRTGEIISRLINDVDVIQNAFINEMSGFFGNFLLLAGVLGFIFYIHWRLSLFILILIPVLTFTINKFSRWIKKSSTSIQGKMADISSILQETVVGAEVVKSFTSEKREVERFRRENIKNLQLNLKRTRIAAVLTPLVEILTLAGLISILWYGGREVIRGALSMGELVAFLGYVGLMLNPLSQITRSFGVYQHVLASAERIFEILDTQPEIKQLPRAKKMRRIKGHVEFKKVSFAYDEGNRILEDIDLEVKPGERIALVGPSGVGKTTLVSLIPRFYDPTSGCVRIDGCDIRDVDLSSLRKQIGIVSQETILFSGSIKENIAYSKVEATDGEIIEAAKRANAHEFIVALEKGYDTQVGERGVKLSGGEKQRIAIARAILRDPRILILDEATSAVDTQSEILIQQALESLMKDRTTFIIAHRLSTVQGADRIVVLNKGRIEEVGSHQELLSLGGLYARLYNMQFKR